MLDKQGKGEMTILPLIKAVLPVLSTLPTIWSLPSIIFRRHRWCWCPGPGLFEGLAHGFKNR
jgi:hypothetical protein